MNSTHSHRHFAVGRSVHRFFIFAAGALAIVLVQHGFASAGLIVDALSYDGHVRNGTTTGVEEHDTTTNFPPPNAGIGLPATNPPLTPPLVASKNLTMTFTTTTEQFPVPGGPLYDTAIIQISSATGNVFANTLDNTLAFPVQFDAFVFSNTPGMKIAINGANIGIENFDLPPFQSPVPGSYTISGLGTEANPLHIQLGLTAAQVDTQNGFVKIHLRYSEMDVPEPTSLALVALGCVALIGASCRRRG